MTIKKKLKKDKIKIDLTGPDGNAVVLLGLARLYLKRLNYNFDIIEDIMNEMKSGDYENLVQVFDKYLGEYIDLYR